MNNYDINKLTIDQKVGQLIMFGFDALEVDDHAINLIKNYCAGNVILFTRNVKSMEQVHTLTKNLQKLALENIGIPLLISIDQEGGMVTRLRNGGTFFPGAMTITASNDSNNAYLSGKHMGQELKALGINIDLAPVLDVNNNPQNPVIGVRSFSDNPKVVSEYGTKFIKGLQENVIATAKHFPGHGDTQLDSHLALPTIGYDRERLENVELYPFKKAINDGIKAIMSAHINFPAYTEDDLPTTLSKKCLTGLLRQQLKFEGLIMTDCLEMKAIQNNYTTEKGALMAVQAGANLLCLSHQENLQIGAIKRIREAISSGELSEEDLNERVSRVLKYKEELDAINFTNKYCEVKSIVENDKTKEMSYNIVKNGATLIRGKQFVKKGKTLVIAVKPTTTTIADEEDGSYDIITIVKQKLPQLDTLEIHSRVSKDSIREAVKLSRDYNQVVVCTYNGNIYKAQLDLVNEMSKEDIELHVIAMRNPYDLLNESQIKNYVCFYEYTPNSVKGLIEYLKGELILKGKVPITYE